MTLSELAKKFANMLIIRHRINKSGIASLTIKDVSLRVKNPMKLARQLVLYIASLKGLKAEFVKETAIALSARLLDEAGMIVGRVILEHKASSDKLTVKLWL